MTSGTEVGQVFVRVNASGDALTVLKEVEEQMHRITRAAGATGSAQSSAVQVSPQVAQAINATAQSLKAVAAAAAPATQGVNAYGQAAAHAQKMTSGQITAARIMAADASQLKILQSQNAASLGDFTGAMVLALEAMDGMTPQTQQYQFALRNLIAVTQQASTQSKTLGKSIVEGGAAMIKLSSTATSGSAAIAAAFAEMELAFKEYKEALATLAPKTEMMGVDQKQASLMVLNLGKAFDQTTVKILNQTRAQFGLNEAIRAGEDTLQRYGKFLSSMGVQASETTTLLAKLRQEQDKQKRTQERRIEAEAVTSATNAVKQARVIAQFNGTAEALKFLEQELGRYVDQAKATVIINREIIRTEAEHADGLTRTAIAQAKAYEKTRDYAAALEVLEKRLNDVKSGASRGTLAATTDLENMIERMRIQQESAKSSWWEGPIGQLRNLSGTILAITGAFYTLRDAIMTTFDAMAAGAQLSVAESQMKLLVSSTLEYEATLAAVSANIRLFGGSLQETLSDMNRVVILSNQTGTSIELLNQALLLLSAKDPQQGAAGAVIALNEALAEGQTISLRRRFELVGSAISYFSDESLSSDEKVRRLIGTLGNMGITMDLLDQSVGDAARTVNELGAASEETWARVGQAMSVAFSEELKMLNQALSDVNKALAEYAELGDRVNAQRASVSLGREDYSLAGVSSLMGGNPADALSVIEAAKAQEYLSSRLQTAADAYMQAAQASDVYNRTLREVMAVAEEQSLRASEFIQQTLSSANAQAFEAEVKKELVDLSQKVADGSLSAAQAASILEKRYGELGMSLTQLEAGFRALGKQSNETAATLAADAAKAAAAWQRQMAEVARAAQLIGKEGAEAARIRLQQLREDQALALPGYENAPDRARIAVDIRQAELDLQREINRETKAAEDLAVEWAVATGDVVPQLERARKEYARIMSTASSATKEEKQRALELARIIQTLEGALEGAKPSGGGGGGGGEALSDQERLNNQLALDQLRADQQAQDALIAHEERMLEIRKDYAERTLRAIEEFQEDQKSGRASFYESLTGIEDHGLQKAMAAQFEAAALEAGKIAQTLGPDVAAEFLQQMQKNIIDQAKRQQEISKALDKGSDDFNPALAEYLQGVDQLFRVSEQGAINQILRARDSLAMSEQGAMQDAEQKYIDALAKISDTAAESAERRIEAVRLAGKEIDMEIAKVQELGATYEKIGFTPGSQRTVALQGNAPDPMAGVSESLTAIAADITSVLSAIRSNTGETVGAIRRLSPSVTQ